MAKARSAIGAPGGSRALGLPDDAFAQKRPRRGLITKSEARAVSLYKLGLLPDSVVWDVGAGSGSVALEAAVIAAQGEVYAIERDAECVDMIRVNIERLGPGNVTLVAGEAPDVLEGLPAPNCVFVGGSGGRLSAILRYAASRLKEDGRIVVNLAAMDRVGQTQRCLDSLGFRPELTMISASRGKYLPDGAMRLEAQNPVFIIAGHRDVQLP